MWGRTGVGQTGAGQVQDGQVQDRCRAGAGSGEPKKVYWRQSGTWGSGSVSRGSEGKVWRRGSFTEKQWALTWAALHFSKRSSLREEV